MPEKRDVAMEIADKYVGKYGPTFAGPIVYKARRDELASFIRPEFEKLEADNAARHRSTQALIRHYEACAVEYEKNPTPNDAHMAIICREIMGRLDGLMTADFSRSSSALLAELTRLRKMKEYVRHDPRCVAGGVLNKDWDGAGDLCSCGLSELERED